MFSILYIYSLTQAPWSRQSLTQSTVGQTIRRTVGRTGRPQTFLRMSTPLAGIPIMRVVDKFEENRARNAACFENLYSP